MMQWKDISALLRVITLLAHIVIIQIRKMTNDYGTHIKIKMLDKDINITKMEEGVGPMLEKALFLPKVFNITKMEESVESITLSEKLHETAERRRKALMMGGAIIYNSTKSDVSFLRTVFLIHVSDCP